jgi:hypothetical protein
MGSPALWEHHKRNYDKNHNQPREELQVKKKNAISVKVTKTDTTGKKKKKN